ncbi:hypothetical protein [Moorena producens]|uniref:hypothetical protein n=1 Tax=Moorena producens TaxID=1155739 RepID=UPI001E2D8DC9|nr:hypothetical protein [Moorena producens]
MGFYINCRVFRRNLSTTSFYPSNPRERLECRKWEELADNLGDNIINLWLLNLTNNLEPTPYRNKTRNVN